MNAKVMNVSRARGETIRHIKAAKADAALCGAKPIPIKPDVKPADCWIDIKQTSKPTDHANCDRCVAAFKGGKTA